MTDVRKLDRAIVIGLSILVCVCRTGVGLGQRDLLQIIADSPGIEAGLCVHIGSTDGDLEIQLSGNGRRLVHGLALDEESRGKAYGAIRAAGLWHRCPASHSEWTSLPKACRTCTAIIERGFRRSEQSSRPTQMQTLRPNTTEMLQHSFSYLYPSIRKIFAQNLSCNIPLDCHQVVYLLFNVFVRIDIRADAAFHHGLESSFHGNYHV